MSGNKVNGSVLVTIIAFFVIFFIFCGFAIDFALVLVSRAQLQNAVETAALGALNEYDTSKIISKSYSVFNYSKTGLIQTAKISHVRARTDDERAVWIQASVPARPFFLSALGIYQIEVEAQAVAKAEYEILGFTKPVPNHWEFKTSKPFLERGREIKISKVDGISNYKVYASLPTTSGEKTWHEVSLKEGWYSIEKGSLGAAQYITIILDPDAHFYWDNKTSKPEIKVLTAVKLVKSSEF